MSAQYENIYVQGAPSLFHEHLGWSSVELVNGLIVFFPNNCTKIKSGVVKSEDPRDHSMCIFCFKSIF